MFIFCLAFYLAYLSDIWNIGEQKFTFNLTSEHLFNIIILPLFNKIKS